MNHIIIGAGFGDEGKGQTVSNLIESQKNRNNLVIRFNGGHQAGHTVEYNGVRHVFSNFGAGSLQKVPTYWSKYCTINPTAIKKEYELLQTKGCTPILYIDPLCPVTTPWDILSNHESERINNHGSVGVGFGATIARHEAFFKLFAEDLKEPSIFRHKLNIFLTQYYKLPVVDSIIKEWFEAIEWLLDQQTIKIQLPSKFPSHIIFEGAQGILLDQDFGFFPHVTRSKTTSYNAFKLIKELHLNKTTSVNYVSRVYHTRHGNGPFIEQVVPNFLKSDIMETNQYGKYQGEFKIAPLNIYWLQYAIKMAMEESRQHLYTTHQAVLTCLDHVLDQRKIPVIINGEVQTMAVEQLRRQIDGIFENRWY